MLSIADCRALLTISLRHLTKLMYRPGRAGLDGPTLSSIDRNPSWTENEHAWRSRAKVFIATEVGVLPSKTMSTVPREVFARKGWVGPRM